MTTDPDPAPRPRATAIAYLCHDEGPTSAELFTTWCEDRAAADGWTLTEVITDPNDLTPLIERPGWQRVTQLLTRGGTTAVITVNRRMVADTTRDWVRVADLLASLGATLTITGAASRTAAGEAAR